MNRFYVNKQQIGDKVIKITDSNDRHHLVRVKRLSQGELLFVSDGEGRSYQTEVCQILKHAVILKIQEKYKVHRREDRVVEITLACAVPKSTPFEGIVDKATQLGVDAIIPLLTERTFVKKEAVDKKKERYQRVLLAAAKQSGAVFLPVLKEVMHFKQLMDALSGYALRLLPNLSQASLSLKEAVRGFKTGHILILIGPEGDFTPGEIELACKTGCQGITLGESVLKIDTAAIAVLSFLRLHLET